MHDVIIVGAGPAGITAGIYAARKKMDFLILTENIGGQTLWSADIENYAGYEFITGPDLVDKFTGHLKEFDVTLKENERVKEIKKKKDKIEIISVKGKYTAKSVIVATGRKSRKLGVKGEDKFANKGVTYCSTCDGPLFADKNVAIVGGGNSGFDSALQMLKLAAKIYIIEKTPGVTADRIMVDKVSRSRKAEIITGARVSEIYGEDFVEGIKVKENSGEKALGVKGVIIEIGSIPNSNVIDGVEKNEAGEIVVDCKVKTSESGIYAAGDVTNVFAKQIIVACGEGAKAAMASFRYVNER